MPHASKRNTSQAAQYVCSQCEYITFDPGNKRKHRAVHPEEHMYLRRVTYGTPDLPTNERKICLDDIKHYFYERHVCPYTQPGMMELMKTIQPEYVNELIYGNSVIKSMKKLFVATWARDMCEFAKPCRFRNVIRWNHKIYWYRSTYGLSRSIDDYSLFEFPDTRDTINVLTYELFRLLGDIYFWSASTQLKEFHLPGANERWNNNALKGIALKICGADVPSYMPWMDDVATFVQMHITTKHYVIRDFTPPRPLVYELDTDVPVKRRVKVYACPWCPYSSTTKQNYTRHNATCKNMLRMYKRPGPPIVYRVAWYTKEEMERLEPFQPREAIPLDILRARPFNPGARTSYMMGKLTPEQRQRLTLPKTCERGSKLIDDVLIYCFGIMFGKYAVCDAFQSCVLEGRHAQVEIVLDGQVVVRKVKRETIFLRRLAQLKALIGIVNTHQYGLFLKSFATSQFETKTSTMWKVYSYDDIINMTMDADGVIDANLLDSTNDQAYLDILKIDGVLDVARRAVALIPTESEFVNYLGQIRTYPTPPGGDAVLPSD